MDKNSLAHTTWNCQYHIEFAPKFSKKDYIQANKSRYRSYIKRIVQKRKGVEIIAAECMPDHVHMFVSIPPKYSVSEIMGYLKGKKFFDDI